MLCARFLLELPPERHFLHLKQGVFMWESLQNSYFSMQKQGVFMLFFMEELSSSARERLAGGRVLIKAEAHVDINEIA